MIVSCTWTGGSLFLRNGEEDWNMPLKDFTETKRWAVKNVEKVGWAVVRSRMDRTWTIVGVSDSPRVLSSRIPDQVWHMAVETFGRVLFNISTGLSAVSIFFTRMWPLLTKISWIKKCLMLMCFILSWHIWFLVKWVAVSLSQWMKITSWSKLCLPSKPYKDFFKHT